VTEIERALWALEAAGVRYLVVGGVAVVLHGPPRFTADLDLAIALDPDNVPAAFAAPATLGYAPRVRVSPEGFADARERRRLVEEEAMVVLSFASADLPLAEVADPSGGRGAPRRRPPTTAGRPTRRSSAGRGSAPRPGSASPGSRTPSALWPGSEHVQPGAAWSWPGRRGVTQSGVERAVAG